MGTNQLTVCRDMVTLDWDAERRSHFVRETSFKFNIVWNTYLDIDRLVKEALESYARLDASDLKRRMSMLRVVTGLLGEKVYFLIHMGCDPSDDHRDNLERQFVSLRKLVEELAGRLPNVRPQS